MIVEICADGKYRRSEGLAFREINGEVYIAPPENEVSTEEPAFFTLTGTGRLVWELLDGQHSVAWLIEQVQTTYDAPPAEVAKDVVAFLEELARAKLITE